MSRRRFRKLLPLVTTLALILPLLFALASPVSAATRTVCASGCDYTTIQAAVNAAGAGDVIDVYPDTYNESVDLGGHSGALTLRTVNAAGTPTPGTATVNGSGSPAFETSSVHAGNVTIEGFIVKSTNEGISIRVNSDVVIRNVTANGTGDDGIHVRQASGHVTVEDSTANDNQRDGFDLDDIDGNLTVSRCTANGNRDDGFDIDVIGGSVTITASTANRSDGDDGFNLNDIDENVTITGCTANDNPEDGIYVYDVAGDLEISNCTAIGNGEAGTDPVSVQGDVRITDSVFRLNYEGVDLDSLDAADLILANGNIICGNDCGVYLESDIVNLEGNWWGCDGGPEAAGCDPICQDDSVAVDYTPWIDTITPSGPAAVMAGSSAAVTFQFSDSAKTVFLGEGPGDLHGDPTFVVTTDNGTVTDPGFINAPNGVLEVTLVPQTEGTATVTVVGPCGLDEHIVLGVQAAAADFVPEPGSVVLLASGLVGLAGYATLRWRSRQ